jgi:oxalate decarboxylase
LGPNKETINETLPDGRTLHLNRYEDMYFIPRAYPHHIEDIGAGDSHFLIFFDQGNAEDIGYTGGLRAYSNEILGATFNCDPKFFEKLPPYAEDAMTVGRRNPVDP